MSEDPGEPPIAEAHPAPLSEAPHEPAVGQGQVLGIRQGASQAESLAYIAQGVYDLNVQALRTNWLLEQLLAATRAAGR